MKRRTFIGSAATTVAALGSIASTTTSARTVVEFTASDVVVETDDGRIGATWVEPTLTVAWDGFDELVTDVRVNLRSRIEDGDWRVLHDDVHAVPSGTSGTETLDLPRRTVARFGYADGTEGLPTRSHDVVLDLTVTYLAGDGSPADPEDAATHADTARYSVTIKNADASTTVSGRANAGAGDGEESDQEGGTA